MMISSGAGRGYFGSGHFFNIGVIVLVFHDDIEKMTERVEEINLDLDEGLVEIVERVDEVIGVPVKIENRDIISMDFCFGWGHFLSSQ